MSKYAELLKNRSRDTKYTWQVREDYSVYGPHTADQLENYDAIEDGGLEFAVEKAKQQAVENRATMYVTKLIAVVKPELGFVKTTVEYFEEDE